MGAVPTGDPLNSAKRAKGAKHAKGRSRSLGALRNLGGLGGARQDGAQLMMLAGIVLTISFILTALTLAQVSALEKEAAGEGPSPVLAEWRFLHERLASNVRTAITPETTNQSLTDTVLPTLSATFRSLAAEKGYDFTIRPAGGGAFAQNGNEESLVQAGEYRAWSYDGTTEFRFAKDDRLDDGVLWKAPCPDVTGPANGCMTGVYLFLRLSEGSSTIEESVLFAANTG